MENDTGEQPYNRADAIRPWQFKKGQSGNPSGRPKGAVSLKEYAKKMLYEMSEEDRIEFLEGIDKKTVWEMAEGKAKQDISADLEITKRIISIDE